METESVESDLPVIDGQAYSRPAWRKWVLPLLLQLALGIVFIYAGFGKALDPSVFLNDLRGFRILPEEALSIAAAFLPYLEIIIGGALIFKVFYTGALLVSGGLLLTFGVFLSSAAWRGLDITCGCFGKHTNSSVEIGLLRNGGLLLIWCILVWLDLRHHRNYIKAPITR